MYCAVLYCIIHKSIINLQIIKRCHNLLWAFGTLMRICSLTLPVLPAPEIRNFSALALYCHFKLPSQAPIWCWEQQIAVRNRIIPARNGKIAALGSKIAVRNRKIAPVNSKLLFGTGKLPQGTGTLLFGAGTLPLKTANCCREQHLCSSHLAVGAMLHQGSRN